MYIAFHGLCENPFAPAPDPRFLYLGAAHREALAHLLYGIDQGEGFIALTGELGTGKTTLARVLRERLARDSEVAWLHDPTLPPDALLRELHLEFGLLIEGRSRGDLAQELNEFLLESRRAGRRVLLVLDDAHALPNASLEQLRLLSNLETSTSKLIQIALFGEPALDEKLDSRELRQLRQRISVRWRLAPLGASETAAYVRHRVRVAAGSERSLFTDRALRAVHRRARGIPRLVNLLCDSALRLACEGGDPRVGPRHVDRAAREILSARRRARRLRWRHGPAAAYSTPLAPPPEDPA